ncbi:MAG: hypothetical protein Q9162_006188 [Coniocarpon cinnabarinum]
MTRSRAHNTVNSPERRPRAAEGIQKTPRQDPVRRSARLKSRSVWRDPFIPANDNAQTPHAARNHLKEPAKLATAAAVAKKRRWEGSDSTENSNRKPNRRRRLSRRDTDNTGTEEQTSSIYEEGNEDSVAFWTYRKQWPWHSLQSVPQTWAELERGSSSSKRMEQQGVQYVETNGCRYPRPSRRVLPATSLRKASDSSFSGSNDQKQRDAKSAPYKDTRYETLLAAHGSYLKPAPDGISDHGKSLCRQLLDTQQQRLPEISLFHDDVFEKTMEKVRLRNEARVIQDIGRLIVPSAESLATFGSNELETLIENVNEGWQASIPLQGPRPQPDYCVGFRRSAFTEEQLERLDPLIGSVYETSFFAATYQMYFPFLTCEVKCGTAALDVADRQNAHSMTLAVRGMVELYRLVKRADELHREILAFSVSHDHRMVRLCGHYPLIDADKTSFYRHPIHTFDFTALDGRDKWTAYNFTRNVYEVWMPKHLKMICSAIDDLPPNINFEVLQPSETSQEAQESQGISEGRQSSHASVASSHFTSAGSQDVTPTTSFTERRGQESKKPKTSQHH